MAHLQDLVSQGFMTMVELVTYHVPEDPASPVPAGGYIVAYTVFYERGFGAPSHQFLHSLLWFYGLEQHHLTLSGMLHIMTFVTLCEAYMGIEPHFDLWNHFFHTWLLPGSGVEEVVLCGVDIYVKSRHGVDTCFHLPMPDSTSRWGKVSFFLRNDTDVLLPMFTGSRPIPQLNLGYGVARRDLRRL
jgi:hypothetical protein